MCLSRKDVCEYEDFCFLLCAFLKNFCLGLLVQISQNTPHPHLENKFLFFRKNSILLLTFRPRLASFWPKRWYERDTNIWSAREYRHSHTQKHIYSINIMFAATQQIASIAGLKATKVQVRALSSSSSSQYSFSGKDLVAFGARARVSLWIHFLRIQL